MALQKLDLDTVLKSESNKQKSGNAKHIDTAVKSVEEKFSKEVSKIGVVDGETLGGIKSIGEAGISPNEVLKDGIGKITDSIPGLSGTASPAAALSSLAGLPEMTKSGGDTAKSAMAAVGGGAPTDIQSTVDKVETISGEAMSDISTFTASIASATELSSITAALPNLEIPSIDDVVGEITPVASLSSVGEGLKDAVSDATGIGGLTAKLPDPKNELSKFGSVADLGKSVFNDVKSAVTDFTDDITDFVDDFSKRIDKGLGGVLQNLAEGLTGDAASFLENIVPGGISTTEGERQRILKQFASEDPVEKTKAVKTLTTKSPNVSERMKDIISDTNATTPQKLADKVANEASKQGVPKEEQETAVTEITKIDDKLNQLDTTISGSVIVNASLFDEGIPVDVNNQKWKGRSSEDEIFTYIASVEELDAEFTTIKRDISEVIVHATETYSNKDIGAIEINNIHNELGHDGIGYHYVIRRDGRLQRGRPVNRKGEHAVVNGHDVYSIGVVMVGGLNVATGNDNPLNNRSSQSFTREQFTTLEKFLRSFYRRYSGGQVFGHNDIDTTEQDPYFDVIDYVESTFRKTNITEDPATTSPLSPAEINLDN